MEKRGVATQVDWIIAMALFLLIVGFIFVIFKPGVTPVNSAEILLDIAQKNFIENTNWEVNKVPIFIEPVYYCFPGPPRRCHRQSGNNKNILLKGTGDKTLIDLLDNLELNENNIEIFYVKYSEDETGAQPTENQEILSDGTSSSELEDTEKEIYKEAHKESSDEDRKIPKLVNDNEKLSINFKYEEDSFYVKGKTVVDGEGNTEKTKHILIYSNDIINFNGGGLTLDSSPIYSACIENTPGELDHKDYSPPTTPEQEKEICKAKYELGVTEKSNGLSILKLGNLNNENIETLKNNWGFPLNREFRIIISGKDLDGIPFNTNSIDKTGLVFPNKVSPPENVNVFSRRFNSFILNDDGEEIPVTVTIQVW